MFFFDESRFGTHSKLGHGWFAKGKRTQVAVKLGFANFYLYGAVEPETGELFILEIPHVNTDCMNAFLQEMSNEFAGDEIILVMDGAGWHKSKNLQVPENIEIILLPPYSPELNPVEKLWQYIKQNIIKNKIYKTLSALKIIVAGFLNSITPDKISSVCNLQYL